MLPVGADALLGGGEGVRTRWRAKSLLLIYPHLRQETDFEWSDKF